MHDRGGVDRSVFVEKGATVYLDMIFRDRFFHADPHPGNIWVVEENRVGLLDCGMTGRLDREMNDLESLKDELRLQTHLGKAEAEEELKKLESDFDSLVSRYKPLAEEAGKTTENTGAALKSAAEELISGVERLRKMF